MAGGSIDPAEVAQFDRLGEEWWNPRGPMRALHRFNPVRIEYVRDRLAAHFASAQADAAQPVRALAGLRVLDIGCGGGLLAEPLARLGATVTAIDPSPTNIEVAQRHAARQGLAIDYRATTIEQLAGEGIFFDAVLAMEVVEHVPDMPAFVTTACSLVAPAGLFIAATLNRTLKSFGLAIVGAEYLLGWLPRGTHRWDRFVTPAELADAVAAAGLEVRDTTGVIYDLMQGGWRRGRDTDVNYVITAARPAASAQAAGHQRSRRASSPRKW